MNYILLFLKKNIIGIIFICILFYIFYFYFQIHFLSTIVMIYCIYFIFLLYITQTIQKYNDYKRRKTSDIPSHIYTYWHDKNQPELVQKCIQSWKHHNPHYTIHVLDKDNIYQYMPISYKNIPSQQFFSDMIRLHVLEERGGIWMDATVYLHESLEWLHGIQGHTKCEFVGYAQETGYVTPGIESWFFACVPHSLFMSAWKKEFMKVHRMTQKNYIKLLLEKKIKLDHLYDPEYLSIYASAQVVLQQPHSNSYSLYVLDANGPLSTIAMICYPFYPLFYKEPVVKFINWQRRMMQQLHLYKYM